jgi:EPS-associated MarR family transcriptional regulator
MSDETHYKFLNVLQDNPQISQRGLAKELGVSLGKANYCLRALIERGWVKARNFQKSDNKKAYAYLLTPKGIEEKARVTVRFLKYKINEYEILKHEISMMQQEIDSQAVSGEPEPSMDAEEGGQQ